MWTVRAADRIAEVMGEPGRDAIRVFVGLDTAPTEEERVRLAVEELDRLGAFDRSWLLVVAPTGTGYVNYAAVGSFEFLTRGDSAVVAMQYSLRPSVMSLDRIAEGRQHMRSLLVAIEDRLAARLAGSRPRMMIFGESLGAWTSQDAFLHGGTLAPWLGPADERPKGVPAGMRWQVLTTFLQVVVDMKNSMQVVPGVFAANGHDYRADLPVFFRALLGIPTTDEQLAALVAALETDERVRSRWIDEAKETGGMSEIIARRAVEQDRDAVKALILERRHELEIEDEDGP